jgi:U3 small nucleolar RNA-associated protein 14
MFYAELKAKRLAKIKSKDHHRLGGEGKGGEQDVGGVESDL